MGPFAHSAAGHAHIGSAWLALILGPLVFVRIKGHTRARHMAKQAPRIIVPPVYLLLTVLAMVVLHRFLPAMQLWGGPGRYLGIAWIAVGIAIAAVAAGAFAKAETPVVPFRPSTALVTDGLYKLTRNPMYLGMVLVLIGLAIILGTLTPFLSIPVFVGFIQTQFIMPEEQFLEGIFGDSYVQYKQRVGRWI